MKINSAILILSGAAMMAGAPPLTAEDKKQDKKPTVEDLKASIQELEAKVRLNELKAMLMEQQIEKLRREKLILRDPSAELPDPRLRPFQFDGQTYYSIPLGLVAVEL